LDYQRRVTAKTAGARDFYRLYMVPGMLHCRGGDAPTQVDWQGALEAWVEKGRPPADLSATDGKGATQVLHPVD
jgi:feruloyl esterase